MLSFNDYLENHYDEPSGYSNNNDHNDDVDDGVPGHGDPGTDLKQWHRGIRQRLGLGGCTAERWGACTVKSSNVESAKGCCTEAQPDKILSDIALLRWSSTQ